MSRRLALLLPLAAGLPSLLAGFHFDDGHSVRDNPSLRSLAEVPRYFADPGCFSANPKNRMYRPLLLATYALNRHLGGGAPWSWHLANLGLHLGVVLVLHGLLRRLLPGRPGVALFGAALFGVHPMNAEVVAHVSSRSDLLMTLLALSALLCLVAANGASGRRRWALLAAGWLLAALAPFAKEPGVVFPLAAAPFLLAARPGRLRERLPGLLALAPVLAAAGGYLLLRRQLLGTAAPAPPAWSGGADPLAGWGRDMATQLCTQAVALTRGWELLFLPWRLSVDHQVAPRSDLLSGEVLAGAGLLLLLPAALLLLARRRGLAAAGLWWAGCLLAPAVLVPLNQVFAEHRLYAPGAGVILALLAAGEGLAAARSGFPASAALARPRLLPVAAGILLVLFGARTAWRHLEWRDGETLWRAALAVDPDSFRAWAHLGEELAGKGDEAAARDAFRRARLLHPRDVQVAANEVEFTVRQALARRDPGMALEAVALARQTVSRAPWLGTPRLKLCRALLAQAELAGDRAAAKEAGEVAASMATFLEPHPGPFTAWAVALEHAGEPDAALALWVWAERVVRIDAEATGARAGLLERLGREREALALVEREIRRAGPAADPRLLDLAGRFRRQAPTASGPSR